MDYNEWIDQIENKKEDDIKKVTEWVDKIGNYLFIFRVLRETGSCIGGKGLYSLLYEDNTKPEVEIYATREAAKLFVVSNLVRCSEEQEEPHRDHMKIYLKNGIVKIAKGQNVILYITDTPYETLKNSVINYGSIFFDGDEFHNYDITTEEPIKLNDFYVEDYLVGNSFVREQISYFQKYGPVSITISPENIGTKYSYNRLVDSTIEEKNKTLTSYFYELIVTNRSDELKMSSSESQFFLIDTFLLKYTFDELVHNLERVKNYFLPSVCAGNVRKYLSSEFAKESRSFSHFTKSMINDYSIQNFGVPVDELEVLADAEESNIHKNKLKIQQLSEVSRIKALMDSLNRALNGERRHRNLHFFTKPSDNPTEELDYDETIHQKCMDLESFTLYDINAYLNGEAVMAYNEEGEEEKEYSIEAVTKEVARKRLVFFVSNKELTQFKPFCYNLDLLEKDIGSSLYSGSCTESGSMDDIDRGFSDPLFKLTFDISVYVRLSNLLKALYSTQKQAFLLIPTDEIVQRTASLGTYINHNYVSGDHCQAGTDKRVYRIAVCGRGSDKCYPLNDSILYVTDRVHPRNHNHDYSLYTQRFKEDMDIASLTRENEMLESQGIF